MNKIGLYIHIPFCKSKCPYCDFYSGEANETEIENYVLAVAKHIKSVPYSFDSVFFGGGTPSLLTKEHFKIIFDAIGERAENAEITVEANPGDITEDYLKDLFSLGVNRLSIGAQSLNDKLLSFLGRRHRKTDIINAVSWAKEVGFENISLDFMIGLPNQTNADLLEIIKFIKDNNIPHLSAYILKVEEGTPFYKNGIENLLDEDDICEKYLFFAEEAEKSGLFQYEISNFAVKGKESKHNLKYWNSEEYLGIGPAAHSFLDGKRFFIAPDRKGYVEKIEKEISPYEGFSDGGDFKEQAMLRLRLSKGLDLKSFDSESIRKKADPFISKNLMCIENDFLFFTKKGFLLSNTIIANLIF